MLSGFAAPSLAARHADGAAPEPRSRDDATEVFDRFRTANGAMQAALTDKFSSELHATRRAAMGAGLAMGLLALVGLGFGTAVAVRTTRQIRDPLKRLRRTLSDLTRGDLTTRADVEGPADVRAVAESVNALASENQFLYASVAIEDSPSTATAGWRDLALLATAAVIENVGCRQLHAWWRLQGLWDAVRGKAGVWGAVPRQGLRTRSDPTRLAGRRAADRRHHRGAHRELIGLRGARLSLSPVPERVPRSVSCRSRSGPRVGRQSPWRDRF